MPHPDKAREKYLYLLSSVSTSLGRHHSGVRDWMPGMQWLLSSAGIRILWLCLFLIRIFPLYISFFTRLVRPGRRVCEQKKRARSREAGISWYVLHHLAASRKGVSKPPRVPLVHSTSALDG
ncbi:hypothetical protein E2C01_087594 [Portunus trituberculatus]|uniref:Uncharacterized protein n=1 Tax=Portunus trituberculatus TaxID=210409 RepID=A0A5B7J8J5_PORTR|nr:hypothetical protein [Portunus trituberculatus]